MDTLDFQSGNQGVVPVQEGRQNGLCAEEAESRPSDFLEDDWLINVRDVMDSTRCKAAHK